MATAFATGSVAGSNIDEDGTVEAEQVLAVSDVIRVNSDAELATASDQGSGTVSDPYVIEDKRIDASGQGAGIYVRNTTKALVIRNCWVSNAVYVDDNWGPGANIMVYSDGPCVIENNRCDNATGEGMKLAISSSRISNNTIWGIQCGINLVSATYCTVENNTITGASWTGIAVIMVSEYNTVSNNTITTCARGMMLYAQGNDNLVRDNQITGGNIGIYAEVGNRNDILNNSITVSQKGVEIRDSTGNLLMDNDIFGGVSSLYFSSADQNEILGNSMTSNQIGVNVLNSFDNRFQDNALEDKSFHFHFKSSSRNAVINNTIRNGSTGVVLYDAPCNENLIDGNLFEGCSNFGVLIAPDGPGIHQNNTIANNTFLMIHYQGVYLNSAGHCGNRFYNNVFIDCYPGNPQACDSSSNVWNSTTFGNYWHDHTSPDSNYDRIVDDAYTLGGTGGNYDHYPMTSTVRIADPEDRLTLDTSTVTLTGTLLNPYEIASFTWYNGASLQTGNCLGLREWTAEVPLRPGENDITVTMMDSYGHSFSDNVTVICTATILTMNPSNGTTEFVKDSTFDVRLNVTGSYPLDQATVTHYVNGTEYDSWYNESLTGDPWFEATWTLDLQEGRNLFEIAFRNTNGQTVVGMFTVIRDTTPPEINITSPSDGAYLATDDVTVFWSILEDTIVTSIGYSLDLVPFTYIGATSVTFLDLAEGAHTFTLNVTDLLGNTEERTVSFTVDLTEPYLKINSPAGGAILGWSDVTVEYAAYDALTELDYLQYRLDTGAWTDFDAPNITFADLPDGVHTVYMRTADLAGNANSTSVSFTVDTTAPVVTITAPAEGSSVKNSLVSWNVNDVSGADVTEVSTDGTHWDVVSGTSHNFALADGTHTVHVRVTDKVGLVGSDDVTFTVDSVAPTVAISSPAGGTYNNTGSVLVEWTASDANGISKTEVSKDGSAWTTVTGSSATVSGLTDGPWTIYVRVTDKAGNSASDSVSLTVSVSGPLVELVPEETVYTRDDSLDVTANVSDAVPLTAAILRVYVDGELVSETDLSADVLGMTSASLAHTVELVEGSNVIRLTVNDSAGNSVTVEVAAVLDTIAPVIEINYPAEGDLLNFTAGIAMWTASDNENGSGLNNTWARMDNDAWMELGSAEGWIFSVIGEGEHTLFVRIDDQAGNVAERNVTFIVDTVAPTAEVSPTGDGLGLETVVIVEFSEPMNVTSVSVAVEGTSGNISWNGNALTFTPSALQFARDYRVNVTGKDLAGNTMEMNWTFRTSAGTGSVTGTLLDEDGDPLANITVRIGDVSAVTDELGRFVLNDLNPGDHVLNVDAEGYEMYTDTVSVTAGEEEELGELTLLAEDEGGGDDDGNITMIIAAVIAFIAVIALGAVVFLKRKK